MNDKEWVVKKTLSSIRGKAVKLYKTNKDYDGYNIVLAFDHEFNNN